MNDSLIVVISNLIIAGCTGFVTYMIAKPKTRIDDAKFVTDEYRGLYNLLKERVDVLEKQNASLVIQIGKDKDEIEVNKDQMEKQLEKIEYLESLINKKNGYKS